MEMMISEKISHIENATILVTSVTRIVAEQGGRGGSKIVNPRCVGGEDGDLLVL